MVEITRILTGALPLSITLSTVLGLVACLALLARYRRAVQQMMRERGSASPAPAERPALQVERTSPAPALHFLEEAGASRTSTNPLYTNLTRLPWRAAGIYAAGGCTFAAVMTLAQLSAGGTQVTPVRFLMSFWVMSWAVLMVVNVVVSSTLRVKVLAVLGYFLVYCLIGAIAVASSPRFDWGQVVVFWTTLNLIPGLILLLFLNERVRAVGPMVMIFLTILFLGLSLAVFYFGGSLLKLFTIGAEGAHRLLEAVSRILGANSPVVVSTLSEGAGFGLAGLSLVLSVVVVLFAGWLVLLWIKRLYLRRSISDDSLTIDSIWIIYALYLSMLEFFSNPWYILSGAVAFVIYKAVVQTGFWLLRREGMAKAKPYRLLLLRVFALGERSEQLYESLSHAWRYAGIVRFISGPDLAEATITPQDFLDFVSGGLERRFIDDEPSLERHLAEAVVLPDSDGRYRVDYYFCHADTWVSVLTRLENESDVVLMDLRSFSPRNAGCVLEIFTLVNRVRLERVIFVVDETTDEAFLGDCIGSAFRQVQETSPNKGKEQEAVQVFRYTHSRLEGLLWTVARAVEGGK